MLIEGNSLTLLLETRSQSANHFFYFLPLLSFLCIPICLGVVMPQNRNRLNIFKSKYIFRIYFTLNFLCILFLYYALHFVFLRKT